MEKKKKQYFRNLKDNLKKSNKNTWSQKSGVGQKNVEQILEKFMLKNFSNLVK